MNPHDSGVETSAWYMGMTWLQLEPVFPLTCCRTYRNRHSDTPTCDYSSYLKHSNINATCAKSGADNYDNRANLNCSQTSKLVSDPARHNYTKCTVSTIQTIHCADEICRPRVAR